MLKIKGLYYKHQEHRVTIRRKKMSIECLIVQKHSKALYIGRIFFCMCHTSSRQWRYVLLKNVSYAKIFSWSFRKSGPNSPLSHWKQLRTSIWIWLKEIYIKSYIILSWSLKWSFKKISFLFFKVSMIIQGCLK